MSKLNDDRVEPKPQSELELNVIEIMKALTELTKITTQMHKDLTEMIPRVERLAKAGKF
jgi:hypothetical protein